MLVRGKSLPIHVWDEQGYEEEVMPSIILSGSVLVSEVFPAAYPGETTMQEV